MTRPTERLAAIEARIPVRLAPNEDFGCVAMSGGHECAAMARWVPPSYGADDGTWEGVAWCDEHAHDAADLPFLVAALREAWAEIDAALADRDGAEARMTVFADQIEAMREVLKRVESVSMSSVPVELPEPAPKPTAWVIKRTLKSGVVYYCAADGDWEPHQRLAYRFDSLALARRVLTVGEDMNPDTDRVVRLKPRGAK